jgi:hypothetical protein
MSNVIVTGITTGFQPQAPVSQLPSRLEWHDFVQNLEYVTLYVKGLQQFMGLTQSQVTSYFQVSGSLFYGILLKCKASMDFPLLLGTMSTGTIPRSAIAIMEVSYLIDIRLLQL